MRTSEALALVVERDRRTLLRLEAERELPRPAPFDWRAWRRNRANVVAELRSRTYWYEKRRPQPVDNPVET